MTIIANLKGFTLAHEIFVINENEIKTIAKSTIKNMPEVLCSLASEYGAYKIILNGNSKYKQDIKDRVINLYAAKYAAECPFEIE